MKIEITLKDKELKALTESGILIVDSSEAKNCIYGLTEKNNDCIHCCFKQCCTF